jgi:hypothetical protein
MVVPHRRPQMKKLSRDGFSGRSWPPIGSLPVG